MSFLVTSPDLVTAAAEDLAGIGSALQRATTAAAAPTTEVLTAAADEVSAAISQLFGSYGREFQSLSAQAASYHTEFVRLLNGGAAAYVRAEITNAGMTLTYAADAPAQAYRSASRSALWTPSAATAAPGGAYGQLIANTTTNLQALGSAWAADPFPLLRQLLANQQRYAQQVATALAGAIQNLPATLANLPLAIQAAIQQLVAFPAAQYIQQFVATQIGFAQTFVTSASNGLSTLAAGLPAFGASVQVAFQQLLVGNYDAALADLGSAFANLLVTGFDTTNVSVNLVGTTISATAFPKLLGPLGDLFTIMNLPAQEAQYLTNLMPPSIPRQIAQNFTNALNALTLPSIGAQLLVPIFNPTAGTLSAYFGLPLVFTYAAAGAPFPTLMRWQQKPAPRRAPGPPLINHHISHNALLLPSGVTPFN